MADKDKVMAGFANCIKRFRHPESGCVECPYRPPNKAVNCWDRLFGDVVHLLREQDTVEHALEVLRSHGWDCDGKGKKPDSTQSHYFCGECFEEIETGDKYCWNCGRLVDWDAD